MTTYTNLLLITAVVVYVVDLSGFTQSWLGWLSRLLGGPVKSFRPFSCSLCMTWWVTLLYCILRGELTIPLVAYCAALSFFSITVNQLFIFLRESLLWMIRKMNGLWMRD